MLPRFNLMPENFGRAQNERPHVSVSQFMELLYHVDLGPYLIDFISADGIKTLHKLALTCKPLWRLIARSLVSSSNPFPLAGTK
jgi:hypothetical protein